MSRQEPDASGDRTATTVTLGKARRRTVLNQPSLTTRQKHFTWVRIPGPKWHARDSPWNLTIGHIEIIYTILRAHRLLSKAQNYRLDSRLRASPTYPDRDAPRGEGGRLARRARGLKTTPRRPLASPSRPALPPSRTPGAAQDPEGRPADEPSVRNIGAGGGDPRESAGRRFPGYGIETDTDPSVLQPSEFSPMIITTQLSPEMLCGEVN